ncbi:MAG: DUF6132 family protein [Bacteroidales bacterium]|nr:DUF6132 family protein [Bacteroidales bacterium]
MKEFIKKHILVIIFSAAGALAGFLYWKFVGCLSGTCVIKSVWYLSTLYGLGLGWILGELTEEVILKFKKQKKYE